MIAWVLLATALANGPGLAALEAWIHSRPVPSHGQRPHVEASTATDHDDRCAVGLVSARSQLVSPCSALAIRTDHPTNGPAIHEDRPGFTPRHLLPPPRPPPGG